MPLDEKAREEEEEETLAQTPAEARMLYLLLSSPGWTGVSGVVTEFRGNTTGQTGNAANEALDTSEDLAGASSTEGVK